MDYLTKLPRVYLVTPEPMADGSFTNFIANLERCLAAGVRLVQLRAKMLPGPRYAKLTREALTCCRRYDARLLLNASADVAQALKADGVHLTSTRLMRCVGRPLPSDLLISAACHDAPQILHAGRIKADLLTVSPVLPTATHTTAKPMGWHRFRELAALTAIPVYALGGMTTEKLGEARDAGAYGIAAIRALWLPAAE